jgi:hypothetical protein
MGEVYSTPPAVAGHDRGVRAVVLVLFSAWCAFVAACGDGGLTLKVVLVTDYRPGAELATVETALEVGGELRVVRTPVLASDMYVDGEEVASFDGLAAGSHRVEVRAFDPTGAPLAMRATTVMMTEDLTVTVLLTRDCATVECPGPGDAPTATECQGGRCVEPGCGPDHPELCPMADCVVDGDCTTSIACADGRCLGGSCFFEPDDAACGAGQVCDLGAGGCVMAGVDAGPGMDAGRDGGPVVATDGGLDGGIFLCPPACDCEMTCGGFGGGCVCGGSCPCTMTCGSGGTRCRPVCREMATCDIDAAGSPDILCQGSSVCRVEASTGDRPDVECRDSATCDVTCGPGAECSLQCSSALATCILRCDPAALRCDLGGCSRTVMSCPGNVRVCNGTCP